MAYNFFVKLVLVWLYLAKKSEAKWEKGDIFLGELCNFGNVLLVDECSAEGELFQTQHRQCTFTPTPRQKIGCIKVENLWKDGTGGYVYSDPPNRGGIGEVFVTFHFKSQESRGFRFRVTLYQAVVIPTLPPPLPTIPKISRTTKKTITITTLSPNVPQSESEFWAKYYWLMGVVLLLTIICIISITLLITKSCNIRNKTLAHILGRNVTCDPQNLTSTLDVELQKYDNRQCFNNEKNCNFTNAWQMESTSNFVDRTIQENNHININNNNACPLIIDKPNLF